MKPSFPDSALGSIRELNALFDQSPVGLVFSDRELRDDRTTFFNYFFSQGQHEYVYLLKVVNPGIFRVSPTSVQPMYQPEYLSTSEALTVTVR